MREYCYKDARHYMKECNKDLEEGDWLMIYRRKKTIKDGVFRIVKEAQGLRHSNGIAKRWATGVFKIVQFCAETDTFSEAHKSIVQSLHHSTSGVKIGKDFDELKVDLVTCNCKL